jgi:HEPN domain-containing protein
MQPVTREWIEKAEGDFRTAMREFRARKKPNYDAACFHAQQCAEKYMKAFLQEKGMTVDKTHDLVRLLSLMPTVIGLQAIQSQLALLSAAAVEFRYPGEQASKEVAKESIQTSTSVRTEIRELMKLSH